MIEKGEAIGGVADMKDAIWSMLDVPDVAGDDEKASPIGRFNWPDYNAGVQGVALVEPSLDMDTAFSSTTVKKSGLPDTPDGAAGHGLFMNEAKDEDDRICYYWGEFLDKKTKRYRSLRNKGCVRFMALTGQFMAPFVLVGSTSCAATYIQSSDYTSQPDIKANCVFLERDMRQSQTCFGVSCLQTYSLIEVNIYSMQVAIISHQ